MGLTILSLVTVVLSIMYMTVLILHASARSLVVDGLLILFQVLVNYARSAKEAEEVSKEVSYCYLICPKS